MSKYLGYFCEKICHQDLSKIAQSGHTDYAQSIGVQLLLQRTLTVGGRITVRLVTSLTRLELTNEGNIILFVFSEAV